MSGGVIIPDQETARAFNDLARHQTILRLLADIRVDMEICELEGWSKTEYLNQLKALLDTTGYVGGTGMSDAIDRQAAIDFIDAGHLVSPNEPRWSDNEVVAFLKSRPSAQPEQRWIPVSERLPEVGTEVLVYLFDNPSPYIAWIDQNAHWYTEDFEVDREDKLIAWMPLPEPYKEEQE